MMTGTRCFSNFQSVMSLFKTTIYWMLILTLSLATQPPIFPEVLCAVTEECPVGTVVCDLESVLHKMGLSALIPDGSYAASSVKQVHTPEHTVQITVINEIKAFVVADRRLVTRDRIDREQYVFTKQCRKMHRDQNGPSDQNDLDEEPNRIDCVIDLELAILRTGGSGYEQPAFVQLPVRIRDTNDHAPQFDQHTSGLWLEADEDNQAGEGHTVTEAAAETGTEIRGEPRSRRLREIAVLPLARDVDYGPNGSVTYSLGGPDADLFELDEEFLLPTRDSITSVSQRFGDSMERTKPISRLRLLARHALDHETKSQHRLTLIAQDQCPRKELQRQTELPITLAIREVNEYAPVFDLGFGASHIGTPARTHPAVHLEIPSIRPGTKASPGEFADRVPNAVILEVPEDMPVGSRIYQILATDADTVSTGRDGSVKLTGAGAAATNMVSAGIHYSLASNADLRTRRFVRISATDGWMTLLHPLDYELGPRQLELPVVATDAGRPARTGTLTVHIRVLDVNDEAPSIEVRGLGSGSIDPYHAAGMSNLDPMITGPVLHRVQVLTVRENAPPGTFVAKISTSDPDKGAAGEITCYLGDPVIDLTHQRVASSFSADSLSQSRTDFLLQPGPSSSAVPAQTIATLGNYHPDSERQGRRDADYVLATRIRLDRETKAWYILSIVCHDHGDQLSSLTNPTERVFPQSRYAQSARRLSSTRLIKIIVLDENDNGPKFSRSHWNAQVPEHSKPGTNVIQLKATDDDAPGMASRSYYRLAERTEWNRENNNNNSAAEDTDALLEYFTIDNATGWLRTGVKQMDRELHEKYSIPILAYDVEFPNRTALAWVHVQVTDINDNAPKLIGNTTFSIEEEESSHGAMTTNLQGHNDPNTGRPGGRPIFVGHLQAEDLDINENGQVTFSLASTGTQSEPGVSQQLNWFLRPDGTLFVHSNPNNPLDRETQAVHYIPIVVQDLGSPTPLSTTATVTVNVLDKNDNSPLFERPPPDQRKPLSGREEGHMNAASVPQDHVQVSETISPGTLIYTAVARDPDEAENSQILYSLEPYQGFWQLVHIRQPTKTANRSTSSSDPNTLKQRYFIIDPNTGEIRVNQRLSLTDSSVPRKLVIFAQDHGIPVRRSYAFLYVDIMPIPGTGPQSNRTDLMVGRDVSTSNQSPFHPRRAEPNYGRFSNAKRLEIQHNQGSMSLQNKADDASTANQLSAVQSNTDQSSVRANALRHSMSWNSELITGLGIGLVVLILVCLLLLITYAVHGTKLAQRRQTRQPGVGKSDGVGNNRIWLASPVDPGAVRTVSSEEFKGKSTNFREAVRNVWNQRSRKPDVNELRPGPMQSSPAGLAESKVLTDGPRGARIYLACTSPSTAMPFYPDQCSQTVLANDMQRNTLPRPGGRYEPFNSLIGFTSPTTERWYMHAKSDDRSPSTNSYLCTSSQSTGVPVSFGTVPTTTDCLETGCRNASESKYITFSEEGSGLTQCPGNGHETGAYYTIRPELSGYNQSPLSVEPIDNSSTISFVPNKLSRVTFSNQCRKGRESLPGPTTLSIGQKEIHISATPDSSSNTEHSPFQCADDVCPFEITRGKSMLESNTISETPCSKPKPTSDSSFV